MATISVTTRSGTTRTVIAPVGETLMEALRDHETGVEAVCHGSLSCATCHVFVAEEDWNTVGRPAEDETSLLEDLVHSGPNSRLSCQVIVTNAMDGMSVTVAPPEA